MTGSIPLSKLDVNSVVCLRTDEGLIAAVKIIDLKTTYPTTLTIDAVVGRP